MREQPTIGLTSRHLRIFIDVKSTMTRIPFNLLGARMSSARCLGTQFGASGFRIEGATREKFLYLRCPLMAARAKKTDRLGLALWCTHGVPISPKKKTPPERVSINYMILFRKLGRVRGLEPPTP